VKTATDRAAEAMKAAETLFADEMGATLDLSRAAKAVLMATIAAAIEAAVAEERRGSYARSNSCIRKRGSAGGHVGTGGTPSAQTQRDRAWGQSVPRAGA